jgi:hypothetical protein
MNASEFLLKFQLWVIEDNVSFLKKRYLFFSGIVVYSLSFILLFIIGHFDPLINLTEIKSLRPFIVQISILVGLLFSLISIGFVYICRSLGIGNLYSCMLLPGVIANLYSVVSYWQWDLVGIGMSSLRIMLTFASVVAVTWLSLRLNRFFSVETPSFKLGYQLGYLVGKVFHFLRIW